jgi:FecR protein
MADSSTQRRAPHLAWSAAAIMLLLTLCVDAFGQATVGTLTQMTGTPRVVRARQALSATMGMAVDLLDKLITGDAASLTVTFDDKSSVELSENTVLTIDEHVVRGDRTTVSLLGGRLIAVVNKGLRASAPHFVVQTPNAFLAVRGTKFKVKYAESSALYNGPSTEIAVMQGTVIAANRSAPKQTVEVPAGYETVILGTQPPLPAGAIGLAGMGSGKSKGYPGAGPGTAAAPPAAPPPPPPPPPPPF